MKRVRRELIRYGRDLKCLAQNFATNYLRRPFLSIEQFDKGIFDLKSFKSIVGNFTSMGVNSTISRSFTLSSFFLSHQKSFEDHKFYHLNERKCVLKEAHLDVAYKLCVELADLNIF